MAGDLYKDKIEVSLDGRQIFYLFFGGAVIVGLVFVLGVMVGKRVEARGHVDRAHTATASDPLAALDRLEGSAGLTFQTTLAGNEPTREVDKTIASIEKQHKAEAAAEKKTAKKDDKKDDKKADVAKVDDKKADDKKPEVAKADDKKPEAAKADDKKSEDKKSDVAKKDTDKKSDDKKAEKSDDRTAEKTDKAEKKDKKKDDKGRFTLQLSSFQDRGEADAFVSSVKAAGFSPYITEAEVDGKGTFYRVRVGSYHSLDAANDAKGDLDKNLKKPATVMKL